MSALVDIGPAGALRSKAINDITLANPSRLIIIAGQADSGKTTLVTSFYLRFRGGPFAGYSFAGGRTLHALEERSHESLTMSGMSSPETKRTIQSEENRFLHLRVYREGKSKTFQDILFSDWPGETFRRAKELHEEMKRLELLRYCDRLAILIDCERLLAPSRRHREQSDADLFIKRAIDTGMLSPKAYVDVVFSKWDVVETTKGGNDAELFSQNLIENFSMKYSDRLGMLAFWKIAARPSRSPGQPPADHYQFEALFQSWVESSPLSSPPVAGSLNEELITREIDQYQLGTVR